MLRLKMASNELFIEVSTDRASSLLSDKYVFCICKNGGTSRTLKDSLFGGIDEVEYTIRSWTELTNKYVRIFNYLNDK